jgi:hypothetical protein
MIGRLQSSAKEDKAHSTQQAKVSEFGDAGTFLQASRRVAQIGLQSDHASRKTIQQADGGAAFPPAIQIAERSWKAGRIT